MAPVRAVTCSAPRSMSASRHPDRRRKLGGESVGAEARGVGGQEHEPLRGVDQLRNLMEQRSEVVLEPPPTTPRAVAVTRRVEHDAVVAPATPNLACDEGRRIVDDPADRPLGEPRQLRVPPRPGDRRPGCVDVDDRGAFRRRDQCRQAGVREQVEHGHALSNPVPEPRPRVLLFREQAHLARLGLVAARRSARRSRSATGPRCPARSSRAPVRM